MVNDKYLSLSKGAFKYNQAFALFASLILIVVNLFFKSPLSYWLFFIVGLFVINFLWYLPSDVKWNNTGFVVEKFLIKKEIPLKDFINVKYLFMNIYLIHFINKKYYYLGDFQFLSDNSSEITRNIR